MKRLKKLRRFFLAILLLPVLYGVCVGFGALLSPFSHGPENSFYFAFGVLTYFIFQRIFQKPMKTYVFGHELTHALAAWVSGGRVKSFRVSEKGGEVRVTKTNAFVALSPYVIPIYALLGMFLYFLVELRWDLDRARWIFLGLIGMAFGFHGALTIYALRQRQPDVHTTGVFYSMVWILLGNLVVTALLLGVLFPRTVSVRVFVQKSARETWQAYKEIVRGARWAGGYFKSPLPWGERVGVRGTASKDTPHPNLLPQGEKGDFETC